MAFCLPKEFADNMINALREGRIVPEKLINMTSVERRAFFEPIVGKNNVADVNARFESKLLLKDQKRGLVTWAKQLTGIKEQAKRDIISKIEKMEEVLNPATEEGFLSDLVAKKLGTEVTVAEAKLISDGAKNVLAKKAAIREDSPIGSKERRAFGDVEVAFRNYIDELQLRDPRSKAVAFKDWIKSPGTVFVDTAGTAKAIKASLDNSFQLRQAIKIGLNPKFTDLWVKNFLKSWKLIGQELKAPGTALDMVKSDVFSRPNALNGKYERSKLAVGLKHEEAFPTSAPGRIPVLGRLFKASEAAYTGTALRMRADLADRMFKKAEKQGIDTTDAAQMEPIGKLVNSMTGRGGLGRVEPIGDVLNVAFFSPRFFMANLNFLTAHRFNKNISKFAKKEAAQNLANVVMTTSAILFTAQQLWPGSVTWDPNSSDFGKIRIGNTRFDVTGGSSSLATLVSRITPQWRVYKGERQRGLWTVNSSTGKLIKLNTGKWGTPTVEDVINRYWEGKLSPVGGVFRDVARGQNFQGEKPTIGNVALDLITPIPYQNYKELDEDPDSANVLMSVILDGLGVSANTYGGK